MEIERTLWFAYSANAVHYTTRSVHFSLTANMTEEPREQLSPEQILHQTIQQYFDGHLYGHRTKPFRLAGLAKYELVRQIRPDSNAYAVILEDVEEEDIGELDNDWLRGLYEVGQLFE